MFRSESIDNLSNGNSNTTNGSAWPDENKEQIIDSIGLQFEDNFQETHSPTSSTSNNQDFEKLPDSAEYLATLEKRLAKIKKNPDTIKQLQSRRELAFRELLESDAPSNTILTDSQLDLDATVQLTENRTANEIIRHIQPVQALTAGEVVPIIKHDHLRTKEEEEEEKTESSDSCVDK